MCILPFMRCKTCSMRGSRLLNDNWTMWKSGRSWSADSNLATSPAQISDKNKDVWGKSKNFLWICIHYHHHHLCIIIIIIINASSSSSHRDASRSVKAWYDPVRRVNMCLVNVMLAPVTRVDRVKPWGEIYCYRGTHWVLLIKASCRPSGHSQKGCDPGDRKMPIFGGFHIF